MAATPPGRRRRTPTVRPAGARSTVVVVEDEPTLRASMVRGLRRLPDVDVADAGTVAGGAQLLIALRPDLLITDIRLPDGSGMELIAALDREPMAIPVVVVSAYTSEVDACAIARADIDLRDKPVSMRQLRGLVMRRLGTRRCQAGTVRGRVARAAAERPGATGRAGAPGCPGRTPRTAPAGVVDSGRGADGDRAFEQWFDDAIDALVCGRLADAYAAFVEAALRRPADATVEANLKRLREMGHGD